MLKMDPNISTARTLNKSFYLESSFFEKSKEEIFSCSWQYVGFEDLVKNAGDVCPVCILPDFLNEPVMLTKDKENTLRCLSNVCTHRGNLLVQDPCSKLRQLTCKYHGRSFELDGSFKFMPEFKEVENFPSPDDDLVQLPIHTWGKLIFTRLADGPSFDEFFQEIRERMSWFNMDKLVYRDDLSNTFLLDANWALYCENYLEGFHIPFVHAGLNQVLDFGKYSTELFQYSNLQLGIAKENDEIFDIPEGSIDHKKNISAFYFWVFPNMMFNFYPWGLSLNIIEPLAHERTTIRFLTFVSDESKLGKGAGSGLDTVEMEDEAVVMNVQQGIKSRFYQHGRYSVTREQGTHHFHTLIAKFIK